MDIDKHIAPVRGYPGSKGKIGVVGSDNSCEKVSLLAKNNRWPLDALFDSTIGFDDKGENVSRGPKNDVTSIIGCYLLDYPRK